MFMGFEIDVSDEGYTWAHGEQVFDTREDVEMDIMDYVAGWEDAEKERREDEYLSTRGGF
jgi:hypothetical protein